MIVLAAPVGVICPYYNSRPNFVKAPFHITFLFYWKKLMNYPISPEFLLD
jgi:hypothetical protein